MRVGDNQGSSLRDWGNNQKSSDKTSIEPVRKSNPPIKPEKKEEKKKEKAPSTGEIIFKIFKEKHL